MQNLPGVKQRSAGASSRLSIESQDEFYVGKDILIPYVYKNDETKIWLGKEDRMKLLKNRKPLKYQNLISPNVLLWQTTMKHQARED